MSFLDHLLEVTLAVGLPALVIGTASHHMLSAGRFDPSAWMFLNLGGMFLLFPIILAAAMHISDEKSFFRPSMGEIVVSGVNHMDRIVAAALCMLLLHPLLWFVGIPALVVVLSAAHPLRWLQGGALFASRSKGGWAVVLSSGPVWLLTFTLLAVNMAVSMWSLRESTPLMSGLMLVLWGMLWTWAATAVLRLFRVHAPLTESVDRPSR